MVYQVGELKCEGGKLEYTICMREPRRWVMYSNDSPPKVFVVIEELIVQKDYRGRGIGTYLLDQVVRLARQVSSHHLCVWVDMSQESGLGEWFLRKGFVKSALTMDGCIQPMIAVVDGEPEVTTVENQVLPNSGLTTDEDIGTELALPKERKLVHKRVHATGLIKRPGIEID